MQLSRTPKNRVASLRDEIKFVTEREEFMCTILRLGDAGKIPVRITHNDTKFNNILFDSNDEVLCLIDFDTVRPGFVHYDFGDAIRTAASSAAEDEKDLSKVHLRIDIFEAYARGYMEEMKGTLNETEKDYLAYAPSLLTFIMGLRFLTDYIDGDRYYKIQYPDQNLRRARAQFRLIESNESHYEEMKRIISSLS
ncbi:MAG: aminoglycoside phosphotransferase family protein [Bacteroidales bacterium]